VNNWTGLDGDSSTVIAMDISPSMRHPVKEGSLVQRFDIAPLLAMLLRNKGVQVTTGVIGNTWKHTTLSAHRIFGELDQLRKREGEAGYAINAHLVIRDLLRKGEIVDKLMLFTDCTLWNHRSFNQPAGTDLGRVWKQYRQLAPQAKLYLFDLAGYGKKPLECLEDGVYLSAGWNEQIFGVLRALDKDLVRMETIENITL
jgi:60 kDa SS-A/Ro ribonucleoprotein